MSKVSIAGVLSIIAAALMLGYQGISSLMGMKASSKTLCPVDVLDKEIIAWIDGISSDTLYNIADFLITTPIYLIFFVVGVVLLLISSFMWRK